LPILSCLNDPTRWLIPLILEILASGDFSSGASLQ
jgi:hypothetical protein